MNNFNSYNLFSEFVSSLNFRYIHYYTNETNSNLLTVDKFNFTIKINTICNDSTLKDFQLKIRQLSRNIVDELSVEDNIETITNTKKMLDRLYQDIFYDDSFCGVISHNWIDAEQNINKAHTLDLCPPIEDEIRNYYYEILDNLIHNGEKSDPKEIKITEMVIVDPVEKYTNYIRFEIESLQTTLKNQIEYCLASKSGKSNYSSDKTKVQWKGSNASLAYLMIKLSDENWISLPKHPHDGKTNHVETCKWLLNSFTLKKEIFNIDRFTNKELKDETNSFAEKNRPKINEILDELKKIENYLAHN